MTPEMWIVKACIPSAINAFFICRFLTRTLGVKYRVPITVIILFLFECIYGALNGIYSIAETIPANALYFCSGYFVVYTLLFHGHPLKRLYFTVLVWCGYGIMYHILLPLNYLYLFSAETSSLLSIAIMNAVIALLQGAIWEFIGRRFKNLRHDLPTGYTVNLILTTVFVYAATIVATDYALMASDDSTVIAAALYCALFSVLGMIITIWSVLSVDRHMTLRLTEQRYSLQAEHFKSKEYDFRQLAHLRHDIKNHLICLDGLLREGKTEQASEYLDSLTKLSADIDRHIITGNDFADAIVNEKYAEATLNDIEFSADIVLPVKSRIDPVDLCCILSNTLDNAIRAAGLSEKKRIDVRAFSRQSQLVFEIKNSLSEPVNIQNGRVFSKDPAHGVGLESVRSAVVKYGGVMEITSNERCFTFSAMLPLE